MTTIRKILQSKPSEICSVAPQTTVFEALKTMADKNIGALLVLEGGEIKGIFSERDYARKVVLVGKSSKDIPVSDIMTSRVAYLGPDQTPQDCMALMTDKRIRHIPILEDDKLIGIVSIGDVVKAIISEQEFQIQQLETYITGI